MGPEDVGAIHHFAEANPVVGVDPSDPAEDLTFDFHAGPLPEQQRVAEVLKEQWARSGITANLVNLQDVVHDIVRCSGR